MQAPPGQSTAPAPQALQDGTLAGERVLDPRKSSIRLKSSAMGGAIPVNGVLREISGNGTVFPDSAVRGTITVAAAASIDTKNPARHAARLTSSAAATIRTSPSPRTVSGRLSGCRRDRRADRARPDPALPGRSLLIDVRLLFFALPSRNLSAAYLPVGVITLKE